MDRGLEERLKKALAGRSLDDLSEIPFLSLDMVRSEVGERWIEVRKKIYSAAAHFVEKRVNEDDVVFRCRGGFILFFANCDPRTSRRRLKKLSDAVNHFFLGDRVLKHLDITASAQSVPAPELATLMRDKGMRDRSAPDRPTPPVRWKAIDHAHSNSATHGSAPTKERTPAPSIVSARPRKLNAIEAANRAAQQKSAARANLKLDLPPEFTEVLQAPHEGTLTAADWEESVLGPNAFAQVKKRWDRFVFLQCWDAKLSEFTANVCLPLRTEGQKQILGRKVLGPSGSHEAHRELDHAVAVCAQRGFLKLNSEGDSGIIVIPVHYETIRSTAGRIAYFSLLQRIPEQLRRYFFLQVEGIPPGAPMSQMQDLFRSLRAFGSHILATIPFDVYDLSKFDGCGVDIFGCDLPDNTAQAGLSDAQIEQLQRRTKSAARMRAGTLLTNIDRFDLVTMGIRAGVKAFSGPITSQPSEFPFPIRPCSYSELYIASQSPKSA